MWITRVLAKASNSVYCADAKSDCKVLFRKTPEGQRLPIAGSEGMVKGILTEAPGRGMPRPPVAPVKPPAPR